MPERISVLLDDAYAIGDMLSGLEAALWDAETALNEDLYRMDCEDDNK